MDTSKQLLVKENWVVVEQQRPKDLATGLYSD